jgi:hypothetical protein
MVSGNRPVGNEALDLPRSWANSVRPGFREEDSVERFDPGLEAVFADDFSNCNNNAAARPIPEIRKSPCETLVFRADQVKPHARPWFPPAQ